MLAVDDSMWCWGAGIGHSPRRVEFADEAKGASPALMFASATRCKAGSADAVTCSIDLPEGVDRKAVRLFAKGADAICAGVDSRLECEPTLFSDAEVDRQIVDLPSRPTILRGEREHACATSDGSAWCWGDSPFKAVGCVDRAPEASRRCPKQTSPEMIAPHKIDLPGQVVDIGLRDRETCATFHVGDEIHMACWGWLTLETAGFPVRDVPVVIPGADGAPLQFASCDAKVRTSVAN